LWRDDGTTQQRLTDLNPGPLSASPFQLTAVNGYLVFAATTPESVCTFYSIPLDEPPAPAPAAPSAPAGVTFQDGVLNIDGTDNPDSILLRRRSSKPSMCELVIGSARVSYRFKEIKKILINGNGGDDQIRFDPSVGIQKWSVKLRGGAGNDVIQGAPAADWISGGDGNDWISGGGGNDTLYGDAGDDKLFGGDGKDLVSGGIGANVLRAGAGRDRVLYHVGLDDIKGNAGDDLIKSV
jgi:Ca2+-binding RTX toxin-like protein